MYSPKEENKYIFRGRGLELGAEKNIFFIYGNGNLVILLL